MGYKNYSKSNGGKTEGQKKRESFDYRRAYLKHNPGLFGGIYICSQCGKPMTRSHMQVDHIIPIANKFSVNRVINCVAICPTCNKIKSDRTDTKFIVKGIIFKILEDIVVLVQNLFILILRLLSMALIYLIRMMVTPLKSERSIYQKGLIIASYSFITIFLIGCL